MNERISSKVASWIGSSTAERAEPGASEGMERGSHRGHSQPTATPVILTFFYQNIMMPATRSGAILGHAHHPHPG
jgi:hypothetical protein